MKLYPRSEFIKLPAGIIFSKVNKNFGEIMHGMYCKTSDIKSLGDDFGYQNLIMSPSDKYDVDDIYGDGGLTSTNIKRDAGEDFEIDLHCPKRDGCFDDSDVFVVWSQKDILNLIKYLSDSVDVRPY